MELNRIKFLKDVGLVSGSLLGLSLQLNSSGLTKSHGQTEISKEIRRVFVVAPSVVKVGEHFDVSLKMLTDKFHMHLTCFTKYYLTVSSSTSFSFRNFFLV